jgi:hypothetical protein
MLWPEHEHDILYEFTETENDIMGLLSTFRWLCLIILLFQLLGCGQMGDLYLPEPDKKESKK